MPQFVALTSQGLGEALASEAKALKLKVLKTSKAQITFDSNWRGCYRANLCLRSATRILLSILDFPAYNEEELYNNIRKHDFTKYIRADQTICVHASVSQSPSFDNSNFVNQKVKDAIADQFREKFGQRPSVEKKNADLNIYLRVHKQQVNVGIDTSGISLSHRGYRTDQALAPLRENVAAGLVVYAQDGKSSEVVVDPMCGAGTLLIEAALKSHNKAPGVLGLELNARKDFSFQRWLTYQQEAFEQELADAKSVQETSVRFYGFDVDPRAITAAQANAQRAGVGHFVSFKQKALRDWSSEDVYSKALVLVNPPYGERVGEVKQLQSTYKELSQVFKTKL